MTRVLEHDLTCLDCQGPTGRKALKLRRKESNFLGRCQKPPPRRVDASMSSRTRWDSNPHDTA
jgi:hypothetical protein